VGIKKDLEPGTQRHFVRLDVVSAAELDELRRAQLGGHRFARAASLHGGVVLLARRGGELAALALAGDGILAEGDLGKEHSAVEADAFGRSTDFGVLGCSLGGERARAGNTSGWKMDGRFAGCPSDTEPPLT
jgi:hypothetical protein